MTDITDFTTGALDGTGVFDQMMRTVDLHIAEEHSKNRIRGPEYAQVYLGSLQSVMDRSVAYLLSKDKQDLENDILQVRLEMAGIEKDTMLIQKDIATAQLAKTEKENLLLDAQKLHIEAQTSHINSQKALTDQQVTNAITEETVLVAQKCKLDAEFDLLSEQKLKAVSETALLNQKKVTEQAQTSGTGVDADSVIGRQKALYKNQADGFLRDAEQKTARLLADTWNVRRTTDSGTQANNDNKLDDVSIGRAIDKLLAGVNA